VTNKLNQWQNDQWSLKLEIFDRDGQSLCSMTRLVMRIPTPSPLLVTPRGLALSDCEEAETLGVSSEALFQLLDEPPVPAVMEVVNEAMQTYSLALTSQSNLTNPTGVQNTIRGFKVGKARGTNGVLNRALKHLPLSAVSILLVLFSMIFRTQYFPSALKQVREFSILKTGKIWQCPRPIDPKVC
jgi:hypothetical protein